MKKLLTLQVISLAVVWSCQPEDTSVRFRASVVAEGWLTDLDTFQYVQLSESQSFDDQNARNPISTAEVQIIEPDGATYAFRHQSDGVYRSGEEFAGISGHFYYLKITLSDGSVIESDLQEMKTAPEIDSLSYDSYERSTDNDSDPEETVYYPIAYASDEPGISNYYRYKLYRNDTLFSDTEYIVLLSDRFFNGNEFGNEFVEFEYFPGDSAIVELAEISQSAYEYLTELKLQTTTLGTVTSVTPAAIPSNLAFTNSPGPVLGFWGVASVKRRGIKIME